MIELRNIVKSFPVGNDEITILHGIDLEIEQGEFVSIVGPSGNGKSTLLNMVTGIDRPSSGEVIVAGRPVHKMSENRLAKWRGQEGGIIFQFFQMLLPLSLVQNVILPMEFAGKYGRTFERITSIETYNLIQTRDSEFDQERAEATDLLIQDYFEEIGVDSVGTAFPSQDRVIPPDVPAAQVILDALFLLLGFLGVVVVLLGIFLVYNSINAIVTQQVSQIGVMKAIGADSWQGIWNYLTLVASYGALAALISIPIGAITALSWHIAALDQWSQEVET